MALPVIIVRQKHGTRTQRLKRLQGAHAVQFSVGTDPSCDVVIEDTFIAPTHARFRLLDADAIAYRVEVFAPVQLDARQVVAPAEWLQVRLDTQHSLRLGNTQLVLAPEPRAHKASKAARANDPPPTCISMLALTGIAPEAEFWRVPDVPFAETVANSQAVRNRAACTWEFADCVTSDVVLARVRAGQPLALEVSCQQCLVLIDWALEHRREPLPQADSR